MKSSLLPVFCLLCFLSSAQTVVVSDSFDTYTAGAPLAANSPLWITWTGAPTEDALVDSTQASSEPNSVYIIGNNGPTDIMLPFPANYTSGVYELTMKMFIVTGKGAYFNLQGSNIPAVEWMLEVYFNNAGGGSINAGGSGTGTVVYTPNAWNDIRVNVDLTNDLANFYINNTLLQSWQWSLGSDGLGAPLMWGGLNLFASASSPGDAEFYVDDVVLTDLTTAGIDDVLFTEPSVYPNPSQGSFEMTFYSKKVTAATVHLYTVSGEKVKERSLEINAGKNILVLDSELPSGIYFLQLVSGEATLMKKVLVDARD